MNKTDMEHQYLIHLGFDNYLPYMYRYKYTYRGNDNEYIINYQNNLYDVKLDGIIMGKPYTFDELLIMLYTYSSLNSINISMESYKLFVKLHTRSNQIKKILGNN